MTFCCHLRSLAAKLSLRLKCNRQTSIKKQLTHYHALVNSCLMQPLLQPNSKGEQGTSNPPHAVTSHNTSFPWLPCVKSLAQLSIDSSQGPFPSISHISWLKTLEKSVTKSRTRMRTKKLPISASSAPPRETVPHQLRSSFPWSLSVKSPAHFFIGPTADPFSRISQILWLTTLEESGSKSRTRTSTKKLRISASPHLRISASSAPPRETVTHQIRSSFPGVTLCKSSGRFSSAQFPIAVRVFRKISAPRRLCARILLV
jgi:hypothetical protein